MIKALPPGSDEVIIVTSSLMKDMTSNSELYKGNSIRVLCRILDSSLLQQVERYFKQAIVDKAPVVASAALISGLHMLAGNPDIVKRWSSEVQDAVQSRNPMVQFHAVALLYQLKNNDRLAISKLVSSLTRGNVRSPFAQCILVRAVAQVIADSQVYAGQERPFYDFLESCLRHKGEMVIFEAAKAIIELNGVTESELAPAITVLQLFLSSSKPVLRFAAVRILNKVAIDHPMAVSNCNIDMETLISDQNRSIATLAITTLLKTGNESSIDRLMKQMASFMTEIGDEFKIVVVDAVHKLCMKFPSKFRSMMAFLSGILREEGGFEYKKAIINAILGIVRTVAESKETALTHLCEFIEDCEFTYLSTQILHLLGEEGPKTEHPSKYIRYIYNRVILENATVRAAAVSSLAQFGLKAPKLKERVRILLNRTLFDNDDEVRDRATFYLRLLNKEDNPPVLRKMNVSLAGFEQALQDYLQTPMEEAFDASAVPEKELAPVEAVTSGDPGKSLDELTLKSDFEETLNSIPEFANLGPLFKSCEAVDLVEKETEYTIACIKHIFGSHVVFQFNMTNTIEEQILEDVSVVMDLAEAEGYEEVCTIPATKLPYGVVAQTYVLMSYPEGSMPFGQMVANLRFLVKEIDPSTGECEEEGFEDEYPLEDIYMSPQDFMLAKKISNFRNNWEELDPDTEIVDEYGIGVRDSLQDAVEAVIQTLGLAACEGTEAVPPNARSHVCLLNGVAVGKMQALARVNFGIDRNMEVAIKLTVRASTADISESIHAIVAEG